VDPRFRPRRGELDRVERQVGENPAEQRRIGFHHGQVADHPNHVTLFTHRTQLVDHVLGQRLEIERDLVQFDLAQARVSEHLVNHAPQLVGRRRDRVQIVPAAFVDLLVEVLGQQIDKAADMNQRRTQVVGHGPRKIFHFRLRRAQLARAFVEALAEHRALPLRFERN
jgi:hypothetical protein